MRRLHGVSPPTSLTGDDIDAVIDLIVTEQGRPERNIPSFGTDREGLIAELRELEPAWTETARIVCNADGRPIGAILADWNLTAGKAWIHGPWIHDDDRWHRIADHLLDAATGLLPIEITTAVLSSDVAHLGMAELAARRGWPATEINHVLVIEPATVSEWPTGETSRSFHDMTHADIPAVERLHDAAFPATYFTATQLFDRSTRGEHLVIVAGAQPGTIAGYVAGRVQPDGEGYIDFLAVDPDARRRGVGRALTTEVVRRLLPTSPRGRVCLTVRDDRAPARALYASLGFSSESSIAAYRSDRAAW